MHANWAGGPPRWYFSVWVGLILRLKSTFTFKGFTENIRKQLTQTDVLVVQTSSTII